MAKKKKKNLKQNPKIEFKTCPDCGRQVAKQYFTVHRCVQKGK